MTSSNSFGTCIRRAVFSRHISFHFLPMSLSVESSVAHPALPEHTQAIALPSTLADAAAFLRLFMPGAVVRSQAGELFFLKRGQEPELAHASFQRALGAFPEAANDGKAIQAPMEIRREARLLIEALGLAVREEDEAGCRRFAQPVPPAPAVSPHALSQQEQIAFYQSIGVNPFSRSGRP